MSKSKKLNRDHAKKTQRPMIEDEVIANQLEALLTPAITNQENYYRQLGLRDRILNLPLMVAAVLTLLWRDVPGVTELTRILAREGFLWCNPTQISQQAVSNRFLTFPAELFEKVFKDLLPSLKSSWGSRKQPPVIRVRLIEIRSGKTRHSYITSVLDPTILPPYVVADLYRKRWRIEQTFNLVKRLLGLSYLWTGEPLRWAGSPRYAFPCA